MAHLAQIDTIGALVTIALAIPAVGWLVADYRHGAGEDDLVD